jgi:hypothetical protein
MKKQKPKYKFDKKSNSWIAFFRNIKGIVGQGETKIEALKCLNRDVEEISKLELSI